MYIQAMDVATRVAEAALDTPRSPKKARSEAGEHGATVGAADGADDLLEVPIHDLPSRMTSATSMESVTEEHDGIVVHVSMV